MTHEELERQLDAFVDGELAPDEADAVAAHLRACDPCAVLHAARITLRGAIREELPSFRAPEPFRRRVQTALREAARAPTRTAPAGGWRWLALAASLAAVGFGGWFLGQRRGVDEALRGQVLASHVRSLMPGHLTDVLSTDQHTVKPWFNGRLDFSPPVYDFAGKGFLLIGGRLDYLGGRPVAALVYGRREHVINLFLWPATADPVDGAESTTRQGYHLLRWTASGYAHVLASDLNVSELTDFQHLLEQGESAGGAPR